jgi:hypothetical protein
MPLACRAERSERSSHPGVELGLARSFVEEHWLLRKRGDVVAERGHSDRDLFGSTRCARGQRNFEAAPRPFSPLATLPHRRFEQFGEQALDRPADLWPAVNRRGEEAPIPPNHIAAVQLFHFVERS